MHSQAQCYRGLAAAQDGTVWTIREGGTGGAVTVICAGAGRGGVVGVACLRSGAV